MHPISFSHNSFLLIMNLISFFFAGLSPIFVRGSTSQVLAWYSILNEETLGYVYASGFKLIIYSMPERSASAVLA